LNNEKTNTSNFILLACIILTILTIWTEAASTILTLELFRSLATSKIMQFGMVGFAIANDFFKVFGFTLVLVAYKSKDKLRTSIFTIVSIMCLLVSLMASQNQDLNISAKIQNETITNSDSYKINNASIKQNLNDSETYTSMLKIAIERKRKLINGKQSKFEEIKNNINKKYNSQMSNYKKNYIIANGVIPLQQKIKKEITSEEKKYTDEITNIENEITNIEKNKNNIESRKNNLIKDKNNIENSNIKTEKGMNNLSEWLNCSVGKIGIGKNIHLELLGIVLFIALVFCYNWYKKMKLEENDIPLLDKLSNTAQEILSKKDNTIVAINNNDIISENTKIGFKTNKNDNNKNTPTLDCIKRDDTSKISKIDFIKYINALYNPTNFYLNKYPPGYKKISEKTNLDQTKIKKIRDTLEMTNIIETGNEQISKNRKMNVTKLIMNKQTALKKINKLEEF